MKKIVTLTQFILIAFILASCSQQDRISIETSSQDTQLLFALDEIEKAAEDKAYKVSISKSLNAESSNQILVKVVSDSTLSVQIAKDDKLKMQQDFGWQCYAIRIKETGGQKIIYVLSGDDTGAMYGALDIAEALRFGTINDISDSDNKPYIAARDQMEHAT